MQFFYVLIPDLKLAQKTYMKSFISRNGIFFSKNYHRKASLWPSKTKFGRKRHKTWPLSSSSSGHNITEFWQKITLNDNFDEVLSLSLSWIIDTIYNFLTYDFYENLQDYFFFCSKSKFYKKMTYLGLSTSKSSIALCQVGQNANLKA